MDPEKKSLNFIFPTKYVIPKSLKFSHWPSKNIAQNLEKKNNLATKLRFNKHERLKMSWGGTSVTRTLLFWTYSSAFFYVRYV